MLIVVIVADVVFGRRFDGRVRARVPRRAAGERHPRGARRPAAPRRRPRLPVRFPALQPAVRASPRAARHAVQAAHLRRTGRYRFQGQGSVVLLSCRFQGWRKVILLGAPL